ncbi:MAG: hypothetical protein IKQ58_05795 [Prevotella sp.]|nr:hypothetical protein [Prevotella sp.]
MSKEEKTVYNQMAWILNYQPTIKEQHIHMDEKPSADETGVEPQKQAEDAGVVEEVAGGENTKQKLVISESEVAKSFRFQSDFVKNKVADVIRDFYKGSCANLALIEITLYDHKQLIKRNYHKAFVKALVAWNIIEVADEGELIKIVSAVTDKHNRLNRISREGYQQWSDDHPDKSFCEKIGRELGDSMPYFG